MEIALKIASKIRANQRFSAYIVIPMWPEGVTTSEPTHRILFWQVRPVIVIQKAYLTCQDTVFGGELMTEVTEVHLFMVEMDYKIFQDIFAILSLVFFRVM